MSSERRAELDREALRYSSAFNRMMLIMYASCRFGYRSFLEIGCAGNDCFDAVELPHKVGVDPYSGGTHRMTSDAFFAENKDSFDIIFIDGEHEAKQVHRDVINALRCLSPGGTIIMHDCNPMQELHQRVPKQSEVWNGDVWKAFVEFRTHEDLDCRVGNFDYGCGIIRPRANPEPIQLGKLFTELTWDELEKYRQGWLRLGAVRDILDWI